MLPYANIVAEAFGESYDHPTPVIQSGGSSAGLKLSCEGVGENTVDIANSSRPIRESKFEICAQNGVNEIILSSYENNTDKLELAAISGVEPSNETISSGEYPVSRPLYVYIKKAHLGVIPVSRNTPCSS